MSGQDASSVGTALVGDWDVRIATPIGRLEVEMTFTHDGDALAGQAHSRGETVALEDVRVDAADGTTHASWMQKVTKPMRLSLLFDVVVTGDEFEGTSRAGRLPRSRVSATRRRG